MITLQTNLILPKCNGDNHFGVNNGNGISCDCVRAELESLRATIARQAAALETNAVAMEGLFPYAARHECERYHQDRGNPPLNCEIMGEDLCIPCWAKTKKAGKQP